MQVTHAAIYDIVKESAAMVDVGKLTGASSLRKNGCDSLDMANILLAVEESFGVKVPDEDVERLDSVDAIVEYLKARAN